MPTKTVSRHTFWCEILKVKHADTHGRTQIAYIHIMRSFYEICTNDAQRAYPELGWPSNLISPWTVSIKLITSLL